MIERLWRSRPDQSRPGQAREVRRHRVVRNGELPGDLARRHAVRLVRHEQAEDVEPRRLRERSEAQDRSFFLHMSGLIDISLDRSRRAGLDPTQPLGDAARSSHGTVLSLWLGMTETTTSPLRQADAYGIAAVQASICALARSRERVVQE